MRLALLATPVLWIAPAVAGPHAEHAALADAGLLPSPVAQVSSVAADPPPSDERPDVTVYGYVPYWADDLDTLRWDALTDVALFTAHAEPDGRLTDTHKWGDVAAALDRAEPLDVHVHLTVANFDTGELRSLLGDPSARGRLIETLASEVERTGVHGVNVDFEGLPADRRGEMVTFTRELAARVPEVVLATPAVDWSDAWDYAALTERADLFIMGYGYHWSGSSYAGPVDPLYGGGAWAKYGLAWSVEDYLASGADPERVIVGLPLYGYAWRTAGDAVPSPAQAKGEVVFYTEGTRLIQTHGRRLDTQTRTPWVWDGARQAWFSDAASVRERAAWVVDEELGGVGFWALNYDGGDDELWDGLREVTHLDDDAGDTDDTEDADDTDGPHGPDVEADRAELGCGCAASGVRAAWWLLLPPLALWLRRR